MGDTCEERPRRWFIRLCERAALKGEGRLDKRKRPDILGGALKEGRLGLTQEKFAAKLGVTLPTINRWENGRTQPSPLAVQNLRKLISDMDKDGTDLMARFFPDQSA